MIAKRIAVFKMAQQVFGPNGAKAVFWTLLLCVTFVFLAVTVDMFGYQIPVYVTVSEDVRPRYPDYMEYAQDVEYDEVLYQFNDGNLENTTENNSVVANRKRPSNDGNLENTTFANRRRQTQVALLKVNYNDRNQGNTTEKDFLFSYRTRQFNDGNIENTMEKDSPFANRKRQTHVALLKVHKAGSTTMQNLFFRFGLRHNLNILIPKTGNFVRTKDQLMPLPSSEHYDVFAIHTFYSKKLFDTLLPEHYVNIAIVREPVARMISAAYYYRDVWYVKYLKAIPRANFIHNLVNYPERYERPMFSHTRNTMAEDFGFPSSFKANNSVAIRKYLDELNSQFLLVLTVEKFHESLVLMRRVLNWSTIDIIYLKTNTHEHNPVVLSKSEIDKFKKTSFLDFEVYNYFSKELDRKLSKENSDFWNEVKYFKTVLEQVGDFCLKKGKTKGAKLLIEASKWDDSFKVSTSDCAWMKTNELPFIAKLRQRHRLLLQQYAKDGADASKNRVLVT